MTYDEAMKVVKEAAKAHAVDCSDRADHCDDDGDIKGREYYTKKERGIHRALAVLEAKPPEGVPEFVYGHDGEWGIVLHEHQDEYLRQREYRFRFNGLVEPQPQGTKRCSD